MIAPNTVPFGSHDLAPTTGAPGMATDGNPALGIPATQWQAYVANAIVEEIRNAIVRAGIAPNGADWTQLGQAIVNLAGAVAGGPYVHLGGGVSQGPNQIYIGFDPSTNRPRITIDSTDFGPIAFGGPYVNQGRGAGQGANQVFLGWSPTTSKPKLQIDATDLGNVALESWAAAALGAEASARAAQDSGLQNDYISRISTEATARTNSDNGIIASLIGYMQRAAQTGSAQAKITLAQGVTYNNTITFTVPALNAGQWSYLFVIGSANVGSQTGIQPAAAQHYLCLDGNGSLGSGTALDWDSVVGTQVACWGGTVSPGSHRLDQQYYIGTSPSGPTATVGLNMSYLLIPG